MALSRSALELDPGRLGSRLRLEPASEPPSRSRRGLVGPGGFKFKLLGPGPLAEMETDAGGPARGREELWPTTMRPAQLRGLE